MGVDSVELMGRAIDLIVLCAQMNEHFSFMYAELCKKITDKWSSGTADEVGASLILSYIMLLVHQNSDRWYSLLSTITEPRNIHLLPFTLPFSSRLCSSAVTWSVLLFYHQKHTHIHRTIVKVSIHPFATTYCFKAHLLPFFISLNYFLLSLSFDRRKIVWVKPSALICSIDATMNFWLTVLLPSTLLERWVHTSIHAVCPVMAWHMNKGCHNTHTHTRTHDFIQCFAPGWWCVEHSILILPNLSFFLFPILLELNLFLSFI